MDTQGRNFCGNPGPREGCYCRDDFVRNSAGQCVPPNECGCKKPDGSGLIGVGQTVISRDCTRRMTCPGPQRNVVSEFLPACHRNAQCRGDEHNVPKCFCNKGFEGDGHNCKAS